jgi:hypothetical protein
MSNKFPSIRIESSFEETPGAGEVVREGPREDGLDVGADEPAREGGREPKSGMLVVVVGVCSRSGDPNLHEILVEFPRNWLRHIWRVDCQYIRRKAPE